MTTLYANLRTGKLYADSRGTVIKMVTFLTQSKVLSERFIQSCKLFSIKGLGVGWVGSSDVSEMLTEAFKKGTINSLVGTKIKCATKHNEGGIRLVRKGMFISFHTDKKGILRREVFLRDRGTARTGSGSGTCIMRNNKLDSFSSHQIIVKVLRYSSLFDKYSDDKIVYNQH